jgi:hypothetical protein
VVTWFVFEIVEVDDDELSFIICSMLSLSKSDRREESLKPLANGFESIFNLVIFNEKKIS